MKQAAPAPGTKRLYAALVLLVLAAGAASFLHHVGQFRAEAESTFWARSELLAKFVALQRDRLTVMRNVIAEASAVPAQPGFRAGDLGQVFIEHAGPGIWELAAVEGQPIGIVTGNAARPFGEGIRQEIRAALTLDAQIGAALEFDPEVVWLYYLSAGGFMYLAPQAPVDQISFRPEFYQRPYWVQAQPAVNPARRMVMAGPYEDAGGKGQVLTFAAPVYARDTFLGVVALDLRTDTLRRLTSVGDAVGESMMISETGRVIARAGEGDPGESLHPPVSVKLIDWREDPAGDLWLSSPVVPDEMRLVHRVRRAELYRAAAQESIGVWIAVLLIAVAGILAWKLRAALAEVTRLTMIDPLTQLLNRRGFYERAGPAIALGRRRGLAVAVLIMDIDFFKKINDTHGHGVGDAVLRQLGAFLWQARRPFDLVCRWGGEEILLLLLLDRAEEAVPVAERLRQEAMRTEIQPGGPHICLSGGLVLLAAGEELDEAIARADTLLYRAKGSGRNHIEADV